MNISSAGPPLRRFCLLKNVPTPVLTACTSPETCRTGVITECCTFSVVSSTRSIVRVTISIGANHLQPGAIDHVVDRRVRTLHTSLRAMVDTCATLSRMTSTLGRITSIVDFTSASMALLLSNRGNTRG